MNKRRTEENDSKKKEDEFNASMNIQTWTNSEALD